MQTVVSCKIILLVLKIVFECSATTHWFVSENGKIQSEYNSAFDMQRPHDLLAFLELDKQTVDTEKIINTMNLKKQAMANQWNAASSDLHNIQNKVYTTDTDCLLAHKSLFTNGLYETAVINGSFIRGIRKEDYSVDDVASDSSQEVPDCSKTFPLEYNMYTFEHFDAMQNRKTLVQHPEKHLLKYITPGIDLDKFGTRLAYSLLRNKTSWIHLNLAAIYWRIKGKSYNALECSRRAIVCAPRQYRDIPFLTTGGILYAAGKTREAAIILHVAVQLNPLCFYHHLTIGHIYATLGQLHAALIHYNNCLKLRPSSHEAKQAKHTTLCHEKIRKATRNMIGAMYNLIQELAKHGIENDEFLNGLHRHFKI